ncbi:hypothetical protein DL240_13150 [Lujinxingia litoralis]|uniref:Uncharacterized protein n=1 Tax=Lujinxingia litoralis TaxID=2211119 RepID=A0A328C6P3_9DELT|nr:hypothetical protein [Lujinxingia litoralis]RAL21793.1 hypothetical protein DL240_13150 [Lujinxingia litoralis]
MPLLLALLLTAATLLGACQRPAPPGPVPPPTPDTETTRSPAAPPDTAPSSPTPTSELRATPTQGFRAGDILRLCWSATAVETCTLSILHASGEGDFGPVNPQGCEPVRVESTTLTELFCQGPHGDTHALLELRATP